MRELFGWSVVGMLGSRAVARRFGLAAVCAVLLLAGSAMASSAATTVTAQGEWFELRNDYTKGDRESSVVVCWHSDTPVTHVGFEGEEVSVWETVLPGGTDGCSQPLDVDAPFMTQGAHAFHVAVKRNLQHLGQSEPWTVVIDRTPPGQVSRFEALVDDALNVTVNWGPAMDPNLRDGSLGSGTAGYAVRYRIGTGAWTGPINTSFPTLQFHGAGAGQSIGVEVTARDRVGNVGAPITASLVLVRGDADPCVAPSPPPECQDPPEGTPVDAESDPDVDLVADDPSSAADGERLDTAANLRHLRAKSELCMTNRCWTTIRSGPSSWAMGMVRLEPPPGADPSLAVTSTVAETGVEDHWYFGGLSQLNLRCRWVSGTAIGRATQTTSDCHDGGEEYSFKDFQSSPYGGSRGNNCFLQDGRWLAPGRGSCDRGTAIHLRSAAGECTDVGLRTDGGTRGCKPEDVIRQVLPAGTCVNWRYVTKDRQWVMVRDPQRPIQRGGWVFIPESAFEPDRDLWPSYGTGTCP
jgi:hypothetical protein